MEDFIKSKSDRILERSSDNASLISFTFSELYKIKELTIRPDFQTPLNEDKVDEMIQCYLNNPQFLLSKMILTIAIIKDLQDTKYYLMDGQHRLEMCHQLYEKYSENHKLYIAFYHIDTEDQFIQLFDELNKDSYKSRKYISMPIFKKHRYLELKKLMSEKYKSCYAIKKSKISHLYTVDEFILMLNDRDYLDDDEDDMTDMIKIINKKHKEFYNKVKYLETDDEEKFFKDEIECIKSHKNVMFFKNNNFIEYLCENTEPSHSYRNIRGLISQKLRDSVWKKEFKKKVKGMCPIPWCDKEIRNDEKGSFQCGHLISVKNGGETTLDNLRPICAKCNQDMGSEDWEPYVEAKRIDIEWTKAYGEQKSAKCKICDLKIKKSTCKINNTGDEPIIVCEECEEKEYSDIDTDAS